MQTAIQRVLAASEALKKGEMIILVDDPSREDEGDLIAPAETITTDMMNFMIRQGTGIVCLSLPKKRLTKLHLPLMVSSEENTSLRGTPFTISIDAREGITTGVSASDRVKTVLAAIDENINSTHLVTPGHIFPLQAKDGGVLERQGHTEGAIDLVSIAGFKPAAVLCEIMNPDGTMTRGQQIIEFAKRHQLQSLSIEDIQTYRLATENMIADEAHCHLPLKNNGDFAATVVKEKYTQLEHMVLCNQTIKNNEPMLVRIHSACSTGDIFASQCCDCHAQLQYSLARIHEEGGLLIYLSQEGRGIGLLNKIKAYALQEKGHDTVEANRALSLPIDSRKYYIAANILRNQGIHHIRLMTNNPQKIADLYLYGMQSVERVSMPIFQNQHNQHYLATKQHKLNHIIDFANHVEKIKPAQGE